MLCVSQHASFELAPGYITCLIMLKGTDYHGGKNDKRRYEGLM